MMPPNVLPRIIFGCGNFGGLGSSPATLQMGDNPAQGLALLDHAYTLGLRRFDTANTYGGGVSERVLGAWLRAQPTTVRSGLQVATKVGNPNGCPPGERPLSRTQIAEHLDRSLDRLGLEQVDLYYVHEFDASTPLQETIEALDRALEQGKIAAFGVSNATVQDLEAVLDLTGAEGRLRAAFTHVQNEFNFLAQQDLDELIPCARANGLSYVAFSPLAGGLLTGKYAQGVAAPTGSRLDVMQGFYQDRLTPETFAAIETLRRDADANGWTLPEAALRFNLATPGVDALIIAPRSISQFDSIFAPGPGSRGPRCNDQLR